MTNLYFYPKFCFLSLVKTSLQVDLIICLRNVDFGFACLTKYLVPLACWSVGATGWKCLLNASDNHSLMPIFAINFHFHFIVVLCNFYNIIIIINPVVVVVVSLKITGVIFCNSCRINLFFFRIVHTSILFRWKTLIFPKFSIIMSIKRTLILTIVSANRFIFGYFRDKSETSRKKPR